MQWLKRTCPYFLLFTTLIVRADEPREPAWLATSLGDGSVLRPWQTRVFALEYRFEKSVLGFHPKLMLARTTTAVNYFQFGLIYNWDQWKPVRVTLSSGPGIYQRNHESRDLNFWLQFYSALEVSVQLPWKDRIGLSFGHISDASLRRPNPGAEIASLNYALRLDRK